MAGDTLGGFKRATSGISKQEIAEECLSALWPLSLIHILDRHRHTFDLHQGISPVKSVLLAVLLLLTPLLSPAHAEDSAPYYKSIHAAGKPALSEPEFRALEVRAYLRYSDKESYRALAEAYVNTTEPVWEIIYAEAYCNLDHESDTATRFATRIVDLLKSAVKVKGNKTSISLSHRIDMVATEKEAIRLPFSMGYEMSFAIATATAKISFVPITLAKLHRIRANQIGTWRQMRMEQNDLTRRLLEVEAAGHFEAYDYWLFGSVFPKEFARWRQTHQAQVAAWEDWLSQHPYTIRSNDFHRLYGLVSVPTNPPVPEALQDEFVAADLFAQAQEYKKAGKFDDAISYLEQGLLIFEKAFSEPTTRYLSARDPIEAEVYRREVAKTNDGRTVRIISGNWSYAYFLKSFMLTELHRTLEAKAALDRAIALSPLNATFYAERGHLLQQERNWPEMLATFEKAAAAAGLTSPDTTKNADLARAWRGIAFAYVELGRINEAEALYRKCLELNANDQMAMHELKYIDSLRRRLIP